MDDFAFLQDNFSFLRAEDSWETIASSSEVSIAIHISFGRFGNNYNTLKKILLVALHFRVQRLYLHISTEEMFAFASPWITMINSAEDIQNKKNVLLPNGGDKAIFFCDVSGFFGVNNVHEIDAKNILRASLKCARPTPVHDNMLCIHVRGGDIFRDHAVSLINLRYRQPPLVWYFACIAAHRQRHEDCIVMLISEDRKNPCIVPIMQWCAQNGIKCRANINSLENDYTLLMNARALVASKGTFLLPCLDLNEHLAFVYVFDFAWCAEGTYIEEGQWRSTPEQIGRMLNLSPDELALPEDMYELAKQTAAHAACEPLTLWSPVLW
jgi:hypothetical protein